MEEFWKLVLGNVSWWWYLAAFFFSSLGLFLRWAWRTNRGVKTNPNSPDKFDWNYWIVNNLKPKLISVTTTIVVIFICLRFASDWFGIIPTMVFAFIIGVALDWFIDFIKNIPNRQKPYMN